MITDRQIQSLKAENGKAKRKAICGGLVIEARPSGKKVFIFRFQWEKKPQTITIGEYPIVTLMESMYMYRRPCSPIKQRYDYMQPGLEKILYGNLLHLRG